MIQVPKFVAMRPEEGKLLIAQGIVLGRVCSKATPCKGKSIRTIGETLLPLQGEHSNTCIPRAMPWSKCLLAFQAVVKHNFKHCGT